MLVTADARGSDLGLRFVRASSRRLLRRWKGGTGSSFHHLLQCLHDGRAVNGGRRWQFVENGRRGCRCPPPWSALLRPRPVPWDVTRRADNGAGLRQRAVRVNALGQTEVRHDAADPAVEKNVSRLRSRAECALVSVVTRGRRW